MDSVASHNYVNDRWIQKTDSQNKDWFNKFVVEIGLNRGKRRGKDINFQKKKIYLTTLKSS